MQKKINPIIDKLAKKYDLDPEVVINIVQSPYFFTKDTLRELEASEYQQFPHFRYKFLGSLVPNKTRIEKINNNLKKDGRD